MRSIRLGALIVDPALRRRTGHHYNAIRRLADATRSLGLDASILGSEDMLELITLETGALPAFGENVYTRTGFGMSIFDGLVERARRELVLQAGPGLPSLILLPTCDQVVAKAVARYVSAVPPYARPPVVAWILLPQDIGQDPSMLTDPVRHAQAEEVRAGFGALIEATSGRAKFICETARMAAYYGGLIGADIEIAPCPTLAAGRHATIAPKESGPPAIVMLGHINRGKGYELLPRAIALAEAQGVRARYLIHAGGAGDTPRASRTLALIGEAAADVSTSDADLSEADYARMLAAADFLLLPYDPVEYSDRGSGVFNEAESLGIPTIVTAGCSFAEEAISAGRCVAIAGHSSEAIAAAVVTATGSLDRLRAACAIPETALASTENGDRVEQLLERALASCAGRGYLLSNYSRAVMAAQWAGRAMRVRLSNMRHSAKGHLRYRVNRILILALVRQAPLADDDDE